MRRVLGDRRWIVGRNKNKIIAKWYQTPRTPFSLGLREGLGWRWLVTEVAEEPSKEGGAPRGSFYSMRGCFPGPRPRHWSVPTLHQPLGHFLWATWQGGGPHSPPVMRHLLLCTGTAFRCKDLCAKGWAAVSAGAQAPRDPVGAVRKLQWGQLTRGLSSACPHLLLFLRQPPCSARGG